MPKIVDHDVRREEIVNAVWRLVSRDGIGAATTRSIAKEAGCSNGILSHYFADKAQLLQAALQLAYRRVEEQVLECRSRARGLAALRDVLLLAVAITEEKMLGNKVELAYFGEAVGNAKLAREHQQTYERYRSIVRDVLLEARAAGEIARTVDVETQADILVALIDGLGMEAALFPETFSRKRQTRIVDGALAAITAPKKAARTPSRRLSRSRRARA